VFVAGTDELEEKLRGFGFERDVADFVDDEQRVAAEPDELALQFAGVVGVGEPGDPFGCGREQHPVPGLAGADRQPDRQVRLAGCRAGRGSLEEFDYDRARGLKREFVAHVGTLDFVTARDNVVRAGKRAARIRPSPPWPPSPPRLRCGGEGGR
jgi:hypothetical protein